MSRFLRFVIAVSIGISRDQWQRRRVIFILLLAAMSMFAAGTFLLGNWFATHPLAFAIFWLACAWILVCVILLAIYDLLLVMRRGREERRAARREIFKDID
jgi:MFS-type transporter involved in bile tolerance (Atg22 family)